MNPTKKLREFAILLILIFINTNTSSAYESNVDALIEALNNDLNTKIITYFLNHPEKISSIAENKYPILKENTVFKIQIEESDYYFIKNHGIYNSCSDCSIQIPSIYLSLKQLNFIYNNQELIYSITKDGKISHYEILQLRIKYFLY